ncbi:MAG: hypothetical protein KME52_28565 [Desmonostoc geniculatum HA4340-LM1]|jgi:hypothetical protein|nr:hypothetical protein [Desmonostoc geniculatum HA4340-LM1]
MSFENTAVFRESEINGHYKKLIGVGKYERINMEVEAVIRTQKQMIERDKKYHEYPFINDCDHFYRLVLLHKTLDVWERCLQLLEKYRKKRCEPIGSFKGETIERIFEVENSYSGFIPKKLKCKLLSTLRH